MLKIKTFKRIYKFSLEEKLERFPVGNVQDIKIIRIEEEDKNYHNEVEVQYSKT